MLEVSDQHWNVLDFLQQKIDPILPPYFLHKKGNSSIMATEL